MELWNGMGWVAVAGMAAGFRMQVPVAAQEALPDVPEGWLLISEEGWTAFSDESTDSLQQAYVEFLGGDLEAAEKEIRKCAVVLRVEARRGPPNTADALRSASKALDDLAEALAEGRTPRAIMLERVFARAEHAMAAHYQALASEKLDHGRVDDFLDDLAVSGSHLVHASGWAQEGLPPEEIHLAWEIQNWAEEQENTKDVPVELSRSKLDGIRRAIRALRKNLFSQVKIRGPGPAEEE